MEIRCSLFTSWKLRCGRLSCQRGKVLLQKWMDEPITAAYALKQDTDLSLFEECDGAPGECATLCEKQSEYIMLEIGSSTEGQPGYQPDEQPAEQSKERSAEQSKERSAEQPDEQPAEQPTERSREQPAEQPDDRLRE